jgi:hypothetical protein
LLSLVLEQVHGFLLRGCGPHNTRGVRTAQL